MSKFYGDKKVHSEVEDGEFVILGLGSDGHQRITKKMRDVSLSKKPVNLTELWDRQLAPVTRELLEVLLSWDVQLDQLDFIVNMLKSSIEHNLDKTLTVLFKKPLKERTMSDLDNILKGNGQ